MHLNFPLREPLVLQDPLPDDPVPGRAGGRPWVGRAPVPARATAATAPRTAPACGVIVAGRTERTDGLGDAVARAAARLGWPLLADPLSGARHGATAIATYDLLLRDEVFAQRVVPDLVVRVGDLPTSKPLRAWLASLSDAQQLALDPERAWQDPSAAVSEIDSGDPVAALDAFQPEDDTDEADGWLRAWRDADQAAQDALARGLDGGDDLSEPLIARQLGEALPSQATLVVASSMPIRDAELYFSAGIPGPRVLANRGANGIDGTVSTAYGVAAATGGPVVLLIGDVALAHDIGGLIAARRLGLDADDRRGQQRRRRHLPLPAGQRAERRVRGARRHASRPGLRQGGRALRPGPHAASRPPAS